MKPPPSRLLPALLLLLVGALAACGSEKPREDGSATGGTATEETATQGTGEAGATDTTVAFLDGFEAAAATAESPDDLIFVYVASHSPT